MADDAGAPERRRVAVLVLGCVLPVYDRAIAMIRRTWGAVSVDDVDVYYVYGNATGDDIADLRAYVPGPVPRVPDMQAEGLADIIITGCSDLMSLQADCILRKRLLALQHLLAHADHDAYFLVCSSSYVDQSALREHVQTMPTGTVLQGHAFVSEDHDQVVVSGSSLLMSRDLAQLLVDDRDPLLTANDYRYHDDVGISSWVAEHISVESPDQIRANLAAGRRPTSDNTFIPHPTGFHDFRSLPVESHRRVPSAYHYHFDTDRIDELGWFHRQQFGETVSPPRPAPTSSRAADDRIFVQIASYRDPELPLTISSALDNADEPQRLTFGICWQYDEWTAADLDPWSEDPRFRIDEVYYREARGCAWARRRTGDLYDGEGFTLQIDAHTRFAPGWDTTLIDMLESIDSPKPLLTAYPPGYTRSEDGRDVLARDTGVQTLEMELLRHDLTGRQRGTPAPDPDVCGPSRFLAGGLVFTHGQFVREVPWDGELYFAGEEIATAARAFTHGYDMRYPSENVIWHLYGHDAPLHWSDHSNFSDLIRRAEQRLEQLLIGDHWSLGRFGLGTVRTIGEYEEYAQLDFRAAKHGLRFEHRQEFHIVLDVGAIDVEPRDDYEFWVLTLLGENSKELHRADVYDPSVLSGSTRHVTIDVVLDQKPTHFLLWPKSSDGFGTRRVVPIPEQAFTDADNHSGS